MESHHQAWLKAHPNRSAEWLAKAIADGFDVHHLDCDHSNNSPENLVLIEADDHSRMHGMKIRPAKSRISKRAATLISGAEIYRRRTSGERWSRIAKDVFGDKSDTPQAMTRAKAFAMESGSPWPILFVGAD